MKKLDPTTIEKGAVLLDTATWPEFCAFVREVLHDEHARENLLEKLKKLVDFDHRPKAISMWRTVAEKWSEPEPGEAHAGATEMLKASGIRELTPTQLQVASSIFGSLIANSLTKNPELNAETMLVLFALSAAHAKHFTNAASILGVKLP